MRQNSIGILSAVCFILFAGTAGIQAHGFHWNAYTMRIMNHITRRNQKYELTGDLNDLPMYDFIVAGAGSAGSTLVSNLLKYKPKLKILLIEAGESGFNEPNIRNYAFANLLRGTKYDWADLSKPQRHLNNQKLSLSTAKVLGGCSTHNYLVWMRGHRNDYNEWGKLACDSEWSYKNMKRILKKLEKYPGNSMKRGHSGPVYVSQEFTNTTVGQQFKDEFVSLGYKYNSDCNSGKSEGISIMQLNVKRAQDGVGVRQDAFTTQLKHKLRKKNLNVLIETLADKVELDRNNKVKFLIIQRNGKEYKVKARYDVIISMGAFRSPLLLMRSGIGGCTKLQKLGIMCKKNLVGVGKNLRDHAAVVHYYEINSPLFTGNSYVQGILKNVKTALRNRKHPNHQIILSLNKENPSFTAGGFFIVGALLHSKSTGTVSLSTPNVADAPIIDPNYLSNPRDIDDFIEMSKIATKVAKKLQRKGFLGSLLSRDLDSSNRNILISAIKQNLISTWHYSGTCKMGCKCDPYAVVDSKLKVHGIKGLRVADASIMPTLTSGNTNQPSMAIGAKCAQIIKKDYKQLFKKH